VAEVPAQHFRTPGGELDTAAIESFVRYLGSGSPSYEPTRDAILVIRQPSPLWQTLLPGTVNKDEFIQVCQSFLALFAGLLGGVACSLLTRGAALGLTAGGLVISGIHDG
jgi:hypothetical protein